MTQFDKFILLYNTLCKETIESTAEDHINQIELGIDA